MLLFKQPQQQTVGLPPAAGVEQQARWATMTSCLMAFLTVHGSVDALASCLMAHIDKFNWQQVIRVNLR
jgi:hypothetical protein